MKGAARQLRSAGRSTVRLSVVHAKGDLIAHAVTLISKELHTIRASTERWSVSQRWTLLLTRLLRRWLRGKWLPGLPDEAASLLPPVARSLAACDEKLGELVARVECEVSGPLPEAPKGQRNVGKNSPQFAVFETAWRFYGVDLGGVPGISAELLCALISEAGTRDQLLAAFPTPEHFASWMGLCPGNRISGGKVLKAKTRKV